MSGKQRPDNGAMESPLLRAAREIEARHETIDATDETSEWFTPRMISDKTGKDPSAVRRELAAMTEEGLLETAKKRVRYAERVVQAQVYRWQK